MTGPVLFLCPSLFSVRNVLHSRMLPRLQQYGLDARVLVTGDPTAAPSGVTVQEFAGPRPLPRVAPRLLLSALDVVHRASFFRHFGLASDRITLWWYRRNDSIGQRLLYALVESLATVGSVAPIYAWQLSRLPRLKRRAWDFGPARSELERLRPCAIVATSCANQAEEPFLMVARERGIPTLGCIQSFDHLTGRSLPADCDQYAVWNERMKQQMLQYHGVTDPSRIHVTGTAQFDFHRQPAFRWSREETLQRLGLAADDRYILYAANTEVQTPSEPDLVLELARRMGRTPALAAHRIVVRMHPLDVFSRWDRIAAHPSIVISRPSARSNSFASPDDQAQLVSTLLHADVCHNMWSSMSLDAAAVDTPVVCVAFAGRRGSMEDRFCRIVYEAEYYRPIIESHGVRIAHDMDELVVETAAYACDRSRDRAQRLQLADQECGPLDGGSAARIAELIARIVAGRSSKADLTAVVSP